MKLKLFRVKASFDTVIAAESEADAISQVKYGMSDIDDAPITTFATQILTIKDLPNKWGENCLPWGFNEEKTIGQILNNQPEPEKI